jgi:hypothetical protein
MSTPRDRPPTPDAASPPVTRSRTEMDSTTMVVVYMPPNGRAKPSASGSFLVAASHLTSAVATPTLLHGERLLLSSREVVIWTRT